MVPETGSAGPLADRNMRILVVLCLVNALLAAVVGFFLAAVLMILQLMFYKTGTRNALVWGVISAVLMTGARLVAYRFLGEASGSLMVFDLAVPVLSVLGLGLLNLTVGGRAPAAWIRVSAVYAAMALVITPAAAAAFADPAIKTLLGSEFTALAGSIGMGQLDSWWVDFSLQLLVRSGALGLTVFVLFCWYAATRFQRRRPVQWFGALALANFRIAEYMVWPLLVGLAAFGAGRVASLPPTVDTAVTVFALGMLFLYSLQGLGIISAFFVRQRNPGMQRIGLPLVLAILFLVPVLNFVLLVGIPLLGVLELWIRMRPATHDVKDVPVRED